MTPYTRSQLTVLLIVVVVAGVGLTAGQWRRSHPELAARLEAFDRAGERAPAPGGGSPTTRPPSGPALRSPSDPPAGPRREPPRGARAPLDVNRATEDELRTLPGIGGVLAARIVEIRERDGPFASLDDLRRVPGLGRAKLERLAAAVALPR
jgi:competence ComEA-like helix-hairpin-helix protein